MGDDTAIDLPTDVTTISLRKSERELTDVPEVEIKEYLEYIPELPKQGSLPVQLNFSLKLFKYSIVNKF